MKRSHSFLACLALILATTLGSQPARSTELMPTLETLAANADGTWEPEPLGHFKDITSGTFKKVGRKPKLTPELLVPVLQRPDTINLHRMEDKMIPALQQMKDLKKLQVEWMSPSFAAKLQNALPGVEVVPRAQKYVREGFDPATFDPAKDLIRADQPSITNPPAATNPPTPAPSALKSSPDKSTKRQLSRTARETDPTLPPIDADSKLRVMLDDPKTSDALWRTGSVNRI